MRIYRMTFDVAVEKGAPDVYTLESEMRKAIREGVPFVIGAEGVGKNGLIVNGIDASAAIDKQIGDGYALDFRKCQITLCKSANESEVRDA